jgi:hypothetical protein
MQGFEIRDEAKKFCEGIDVNEGTIIQYYDEISDLVTIYARLYHEHLQEATTILELAHWKAMILRSSGDKQGLTRVGCPKLVLTFL